MTDINKQIEEGAREYATKKLIYPPLLVANARMKIAVSNVTFNAYKSGYESALHCSRWRKVSDEHDIPYYTPLLVRFHDGDVKVGYYLDHKYREDNFYEINDNGIEFLIDSVIEWKPID